MASVTDWRKKNAPMLRDGERVFFDASTAGMSRLAKRAKNYSLFFFTSDFPNAD